MTNFSKRLRRALAAKDLKQIDLARKIGVSHVAVGAWVHGESIPKPDKLATAARILDVSVDWLLSGNGDFPSEPIFSNISKVKRNIKQSGKVIPVYGQVVGGEYGEFVLNGSILFEVLAPSILSEISEAYAVQVTGDSMEPRFDDGEIAYVDPTRRVIRGDDVIAQIRHEEEGPILAFLKKFKSHNNTELVLSQFNPPKELRFPHDKVVSVHCVVGRTKA